MSISSSSFFTFVRRDFSSFSFFTTWHNKMLFMLINCLLPYSTITLLFTPSTKTFAGLNAGML